MAEAEMTGTMFDSDTVVVSGGASGIGRSTCEAFLEAGANVAVLDVRATPRRDVPPVAEIAEAAGQEAVVVETDVTDEDDVAAAFEMVSATFGDVDHLVNNAGVFKPGSATDTTLDDWSIQFEVNATGALLCCKYAIPSMDAGSSIVNVASVFAVTGGVGNAGYTASKGGLCSLTRQLAVEYGPDGIRSNAVLPGFIETEMLERDTPRGTEEYATNRTPQRRLGTPEDVAGTIRFLASDDAGFINGQLIAVDGGFTA